jgi:hypothetical protein
MKNMLAILTLVAAQFLIVGVVILASYGPADCERNGSAIGETADPNRYERQQGITLRLWIGGGSDENDQRRALAEVSLAIGDRAMHFVMLDGPAWLAGQIQEFAKQ